MNLQNQLRRSGLLLLSFLITFTLYAQNVSMRGVIKDQNGLPLQGASITIEGRKLGTTTDVNGAFLLNVPPGNYTIVISYVGYQTQRQQVEVPAGGLTNISYNLTSGSDLNRVVIVGSRSTAVRSTTQTAVPVDVVSARELQATGQIEPTQMLNFVVPSYNSSRQTIADGTDHIDPATIRGLGPDQVLVLVNGRRRYNQALLNVNGTIGRGSVGTDMNSIVPSAIERIEVLRDGASSQYGSDAIAGVVNVVMKKQNHGTTIFSHLGQHYAGDGMMRQVGLTQGFKLGKEGFLTISGDWRHRGFTNRAGKYTGLVYTNDAASDEQVIRERGFSRFNNMFIGNSEVENKGVIVNAGIPISSKLQFFLTGGLNRRDGEAYGFYRYPRQTSQVINALYPDGFLPQIASKIIDRSIVAGVEGKLGSGWNWDLSQASGGNSFRFDINNTNNATQVALGANAPTRFYAGTLRFNQHTTNLNFSKDFGKRMGFQSLNFAAGAELRFDRYQIEAGEEGSYANYAPGTGRAPGAQVFPGFTPANAVNEGRRVIGGYIDLESDVTNRFLVSAAARFENYSDFGSNFAGKIAMRYKLLDALSIRGSVSNGFRAPSLHQRFFSNVATVFVNTTGGLTPVQNATFRNNSDIAKAFGIPSLTAETSMNYSVGLTSRTKNGWSATIDAYQIDIKNRIILTGAFNRAASPVVNQLLSQFPDVNSAAFFTNAIDTRTRGIDIVIAKSLRMGAGNLNATLAGNFNKTEVTNTKQQSTQLSSDASLNNKILFNAEERGRIERGQPRNKFTLGINYAIKKFNLNLRTTRFGEVSTIFFNTSNFQTDATRDENFSAKFITDASVSYKLFNFLTWTIGANNIGDVYPDKLRNPLNTSDGRFVYSRNATQFGFNGGYYYTSLIMELHNIRSKK
jgi:iron complex outermembrane receptor protein